MNKLPLFFSFFAVSAFASGSAFFFTSGVPGFSPLDVSGLTVWCRSDMGVTHSGTVSACADQSGNGNDLVQATPGNQPTFISSDSQYSGKPSFSFDRTATQYLATSGSVSYGAHTVFIVARITSFLLTAPIYSHGFVLDELNGTNDGTVYTLRSAVVSLWNLGASWAVTATPKIMAMRFDGTHVGHTLSINGVDQVMGGDVGGTGDPGTGAASGVVSISARTNATSPITMTFAEALVYNSAISGADVTRVVNYLNAKYALY